MDIRIIGAGAVASVICTRLAKDKPIKSIACATNDMASAREFIPRARKVSVQRVDARDPKSLDAFIKGGDLVINASLPIFNVNILKSALRAGAHYQDTCSNLANLKDCEQLKYARAFKKAGLVGLINAGVAPGLTNLLARMAKDKLDSVDSLRIFAIEEQKAKAFVSSWSPEVVFDEVMAPPLIFKGGKFHIARPFAYSMDETFPTPVGKKRLFLAYGDEIATIPLYLKVKSADMFIGGEDMEIMFALHAAGMLGKEKVRVGDVHVRPADVLHALLPPVPSPKRMRQMIRSKVITHARFSAFVAAKGRLRRQPVTIMAGAIFPNITKIPKECRGSTYISYPTGICASAFARQILSLEPGVYPPEVLPKDRYTPIIDELKEEGVRITLQSRRI